jgi:hypothetical protein
MLFGGGGGGDGHGQLAEGLMAHLGVELPTSLCRQLSFAVVSRSRRWIRAPGRRACRGSAPPR